MSPKYIYPIKVTFHPKEGSGLQPHSHYYLTVDEAIADIKEHSVESARILKATPGTELCTDWDGKEPFIYIRPLVEVSPVIYTMDFYIRDWAFDDPDIVSWFRVIYDKSTVAEKVAGILRLVKMDAYLDEPIPYYPSFAAHISKEVDENSAEGNLMHSYIKTFYLMTNKPDSIIKINKMF